MRNCFLSKVDMYLFGNGRNNFHSSRLNYVLCKSFLNIGLRYKPLKTNRINFSKMYSFRLNTNRRYLKGTNKTKHKNKNEKFN